MAGSGVRKPKAISQVRRGKWSPPFDKELSHIGENARRPGEQFVVIKLCNYRGKSIHFAVWAPQQVLNSAMFRAFGWPAFVVAFAVVLMLQFSVRLEWVLLTLIIAAFGILRFVNRYGGRFMRLWENCTGFAVLDEKGRFMKDTSNYADYFMAFATWEEAYLRPAVLCKISAAAVESRLRIMRQVSRLNRQVNLRTKKKLDQQLQNMHEKLSRSEEKLANILEEGQTVAIETNNLLLKISEDMQIRRTELVRRLTRLRNSYDRMSYQLNQRADDYEYWLQLMEAKGFRIRYTHWGFILVGVGGIISALLSGRPYPLLLLILPIVKYGIDYIGGVRGLKRRSRSYRKAESKIETAIARLSPRFESSLVRIPV